MTLSLFCRYCFLSIICAYAFGFQADIRRHERDYSFAQKEIADLQREVIEECKVLICMDRILFP